METKQRHGLLTTWIIIAIIINSMGIFTPFWGNSLNTYNSNGVSNSIPYIISIFSILGVICSILIYKWKKLGFWGFIIYLLCGFSVNLFASKGIVYSLIMGLISFSILFGVLQFKKGGKSGWDNLE